MTTSSQKVIRDVTLILPNCKLTQQSVLIENDQILDIVDDPAASAPTHWETPEVISGKGGYLTPGLIDLQINGGFGINFGNAGLKEIQTVLQKLPKHGVTRILPTLITAPVLDMAKAVSNLEQLIHMHKPTHAQIMGLHLEGPMLNPQLHGAHPIEHILKDSSMENDLQVLLSPNLKLVTLAPETDPQGSMIRSLTQRKVKVLAGHSNATESDITDAIKSGLCGVTHLYNAMRPFHHRDPGIIGATLTQDSLYANIIADGVHVHPTALEILLRCKHFSKINLVSDAMPLAGLETGSEQFFGGKQVIHQGHQAINSQGAMAGSTCFLDDCIRNIVNWKLLPFEKAVALAGMNPAEFLGQGNTLGKIAKGHIADLVLWDKDALTVQATWIGGHLAYADQTVDAKIPVS
ncbi:MAG: N-acetylglucosamine-6-phosphate deacetylase [Vampirovibrio sp.]|nr:N-acetylglucosamine-6-phosphate deacetylase [Vampirovibrio sp.]